MTITKGNVTTDIAAQGPISMLESLPPAAPARVFDAAKGSIDQQEVVQHLQERGFCVLRNLFSQDALSTIIDQTESYLRRPAVAGAIGFSKVDHPKKMLNPFVLGGDVVDLVLEERVIDIVEAAMASECILAETMIKFDRGVGYEYFSMHSDFAAGWSKSAESEFKLAADDLNQVIGVGAAIYLHDTTAGAFCYCDGTHRLIASRGQNINDYPPDERKSILDRCIRCDGRKGDLVLFDDRGFHGPDQPCRSDRLVVLIDFYRVQTFGRTQVSPIQLWTSDLARFSRKQLRVVGAGADYMVAPSDYAHSRFQRNALYPLLCRIIDGAFMYSHVKNHVKKFLRA